MVEDFTEQNEDPLNVETLLDEDDPIIIDKPQVQEIKKEPFDEDFREQNEDPLNVETLSDTDDPIIIDKPQVQEMFDVQKRKAQGLYLGIFYNQLNDNVIM